MATIRDKSISPGKGLHFPIAQTGYTATGSHYQQLLSDIRQHCSANQIEQPTEEGIQQWLCDNIPLRCTEGGKLYDNQYVDRRNWPLVLKPMRLLSREGDKGLGDIVERNIPKGDGFKAWFKTTFGFSCGCDERKNWLNQNYPL